MKKCLFIRLAAVVTSLVCAFALLSFAQVHAFAEDGTELPYEIRATIITSEKLSDLELMDGWTSGIFKLSDSDHTKILSQKQLNPQIHRYEVVYTVQPSSPDDYSLGSKSKFKLCTEQYYLSDDVSAEVKKDDSKKVLYSDFTFRESFSPEYPVKLVDADTKQAISIAPPLKDIEFLLGDKPQLLNIVSDDSGGLKLSYDAALDDTGKLPQLALDQSGLKKVYKFGEKYYQCTSVKTMQDENGPYISLALRDVTKNMKTVHVVLTRPFYLGASSGQAYANFRVSSSMGFQDVALSVRSGKDDIKLDVMLPCAEHESQIDAQLIPAKGTTTRAWMDSAFLAKGTYDARTQTYTTKFLRELLLNITPVGANMTMEGLDKAKSLEGLSATLKNDKGESVKEFSFTRETVPTKNYGSLPYHLRGLLPGTYTLQFFSTNENIQKTYDLSTVYKLSLDEDGFIKTSHLGDDQQTLYYPAGIKTRTNAPGESYMLGSKTAVNIALALRPKVEKCVRIAKDDKAQFMQKVTANTGDTVQFDIAITLPRDYNLIWQCAIPNSFTLDIAGHAHALQLNDVIDSHLSLVEGSAEILDGQLKPIKKEDMRCAFDKDKHTLTLTDKRPSKVQQIPTSGEHAFALALRNAEETIHLRFKAKVTGFGTSNEIKNTVEGSTATIVKPEPAPEPAPVPPTPQPEPKPTPEPPVPAPLPPAPEPRPAPVPHVPSLPLPQPPLTRLVPAETLQAPAVTPAPAPAAPEPALPQTGDESAPAALLGSVAALLSMSFCALGLVLHTRACVRG